jgi:hypothetical protein
MLQFGSRLALAAGLVRATANMALMYTTLLGMVTMLGAHHRLSAAEPTRDEVREGLRKASAFFREQCSAGGGYVFRVSEDLTLREGEAKVGPTTAWIEPPATPAVGLAYLEAYQLTGEPSLLQAAQATAEALLQGQMLSGGWTEQIEFAAADRRAYAYRVDNSQVAGRRNTTTFDDDKTQSAIRYLMRLDLELKQTDERLHEAVVYALNGVLQAQYACGAWPQKYDGVPVEGGTAALQASYPESWPREFPNQKYTGYYTLNDGTLSDLIQTLLEAGEAYQDSRYTDAALRGGEFLLRAQMPEPQPGWAQQYTPDMHPAWARKFEPPAISGGESQEVMRLLLTLYRHTADRRYLQAVERGLAYYQKSLLPSGKLARFYELHTNRPLYFTTTYELTYADDDLPTHYGFIVSSGLERLARDLKKLSQLPKDKVTPLIIGAEKPQMSAGLRDEAARTLAELDERGAWVEEGKLRSHPDSNVQRIISSATFIENLQTLAQFIAASVP